ncbi:hypothetical protein H9X87_00600 [Pseudoflavonifractor capillosus]|uniref:NAD(P)-dependent oxidoreductase n=1 Tax=Pseudoflavonifractor capillosus TaxID=106588 RepID=UPI001958572B|nr:NAD(P)-dependent oxidoreductase [Pseudoflavonifractor capillosus]MBM6693273.1 hypothetical protein [Pseudoflavonifractor capillosus]
MRIVLTDKDLDNSGFPSDVQVVKITYKTMDAYENNCDVIAIAGSRAMAIKANRMDFPGLKFFQLTSAGFDGVPLAEYRNKGVMVANAGSTYSVPIAETVVFGMLLMAKKLHANPNNRHVKIQRHYIEIQELYAKKVMILGAGSIGTEIAKRLSGFDMIVDGYAQSEGTRPFFNRVICGRNVLIGEIANYDYVISTLPDSESTRGFFDKELLSRMKQTSVIVNVGRKAVFNENDLFDALNTKSICGAVLDMFERLPNPVTNRFRRLRNVIVLPGVSAISQEVNGRLKMYCTNNIRTILDNRIPQNIVNKVEI